MTLKGHGEVWGESDFWFPLQLRKNSAKFIQANQRVEISNFMRLFYLKDMLFQPKTVAGVSSCDTEGPWIVWRKTYSWFPIPPKKNWVNSLRAGEKVKISNFSSWFCLMINSLSKKLTQQFPVLTLKGHGKFGGKVTPGFQLSPENSWILLDKTNRHEI